MTYSTGQGIYRAFDGLYQCAAIAPNTFHELLLMARLKQRPWLLPVAMGQLKAFRVCELLTATFGH